MAHYIHNVPGRLRITLPAIRTKREACRELEGILNDMYGVESAVVKPVTGSVIVNYDPRLTEPESILATLQEKGYYNPSLAAENNRRVSTEKAGEAICRAALGWFVGRALEGNGLSFLAAFI